jgi:hypothetical protein
MKLPLYKGFTLEITNKWWPLTTLNRLPLYRIKIYSKMHRESTKVTVMSKWPLYKGDRYDRFDCSYMVKYLIKFVVIINRRWEKLIYLWTGSFFFSWSWFQNNKCLELFWPYRWSNAFGHFRQRRVLYEKFGNKCVKILKFWKTDLSYAQNKNRSEKMRLLGMDTCPSLNDIMEIRCNKRARLQFLNLQSFMPCQACGLLIVSI